LTALKKDLDIATLMEAVGKSDYTPIPFWETSGEMDRIITINLNGTLKVTQIVAPGTAPRIIGVIMTSRFSAGVLHTPISPT